MGNLSLERIHHFHLISATTFGPSDPSMTTMARNQVYSMEKLRNIVRLSYEIIAEPRTWFCKFAALFSANRNQVAHILLQILNLTAELTNTELLSSQYCLNYHASNTHFSAPCPSAPQCGEFVQTHEKSPKTLW